MTTDDLDTYRKQLTALLRALEQGGPLQVEPNRSGESERPDDDFQALNEMHQSIASGRNRNQAEVLQQIRDALDKLQHEPEEFGLCEECEAAIPAGRLKLMPYAPRCVKCQSALEMALPTGRRHLTDYR